MQLQILHTPPKKNKNFYHIHQQLVSISVFGLVLKRSLFFVYSFLIYPHVWFVLFSTDHFPATLLFCSSSQHQRMFTPSTFDYNTYICSCLLHSLMIPVMATASNGSNTFSLFVVAGCSNDSCCAVSYLYCLTCNRYCELCFERIE